MLTCAPLALLVPLSFLPAPQLAAPMPQVAWVGGDLVRAQERALSEQRPLVVFLCPEEDARALETLERGLGSWAAAAALEGALCLDLRRDAARSAEVRSTHGLGTRALALCLAPGGERIDVLTAVATPDELVLGCQRMLSGRDTLHDLEERWRGCKPDSAVGLELCSALYERLRELDEPGRCLELRTHLEKRDPKGLTRAGAMLQLAQLEERLRAEAASADATSMSMPDHTPLQVLARKARFPEVRCAAWRSLGAALEAEGDGLGALDCALEAFAAASDEQREALGLELVQRWLGVGEKLEPLQRKKLLALAQAVLDSAEELAADAAAWRARHPVSAPAALLAERQRLLAQALRLNGKEKQAQAAEARAVELETAAGILKSPRRR